VLLLLLQQQKPGQVRCQPERVQVQQLLLRVRCCRVLLQQDCQRCQRQGTCSCSAAVGCG
jgi:hypothetical protein